VDLDRSVPGQGLVRANGVVVDPVGFGVLDQRERVVDLAEEQPFVLQGIEAAFTGSVLPGRADPGEDVAQFGVAGYETPRGGTSRSGPLLSSRSPPAVVSNSIVLATREN
jgi:hypothetical protein